MLPVSDGSLSKCDRRPRQNAYQVPDTTRASPPILLPLCYLCCLLLKFFFAFFCSVRGVGEGLPAIRSKNECCQSVTVLCQNATGDRKTLPGTRHDPRFPPNFASPLLPLPPSVQIFHGVGEGLPAIRSKNEGCQSVTVLCQSATG
jgi:hypothetical protein